MSLLLPVQLIFVHFCQIFWKDNTSLGFFLPVKDFCEDSFLPKGLLLCYLNCGPQQMLFLCKLALGRVNFAIFVVEEKFHRWILCRDCEYFSPFQTDRLLYECICFQFCFFGFIFVQALFWAGKGGSFLCVCKCECMSNYS